MATPNGGYALGHILAGGNVPNTSYAEAQGENLGANTQNAIAQAQERQAKNAALAKLPELLKGLYQDHPEVAAALGGGAQAGVPLEQITGSRLQDQQFNNRRVIADPNTPDADAVAAAQAVDPAGLSKGALGITQAGEAFQNIRHPDRGVAPTGVNTPKTALETAQAGEAVAKGHLAQTQSDVGGFNPNTGFNGARLSPEDQATLADLEARGIIDPNHVTRFNANPGALAAANKATGGGTGVDPTNSGTAHSTIQQSEKDLASIAPNSTGGKIRAGTTLTQHLGAMQHAADLADASDLPGMQRIASSIGAEIGSDIPTQLRLISHFVGGEMDTFLAASGGTLEGRNTASNLFNGTEIGAKQLRTNAAVARDLMGGQFASLKQNYLGVPGGERRPNWNQRFPLAGQVLSEWEAKHGEVKAPQYTARPAAAAAPGAATAPPAAPGAPPAPAAAPSLQDQAAAILKARTGGQ